MKRVSLTVFLVLAVIIVAGYVALLSQMEAILATSPDGYGFYAKLSGYAKDGVNIASVYITISVLICAAFLFFSELIPIATTAILIPVALSTFWVISVKDAWISFGNTAIMTIVGLFMLGEATFSTGFAQRCARGIIQKAGKSETMLLIVSIAIIGFMSAFLNNSGITAITLPLLISIARQAHLSPSRILLPTAYVASAGGTLSLVGTAPNMVTNALITEMAPGVRTFGFFEFGLYGLPLMICIILMYVLFNKWLIPNKQTTDNFVMEEEEEIPYTPKMWIAGGIYLGVIVCMATGWVPLTSAAMLGAMLCVLTRCMSMDHAIKSVDWATIYIFAGALALSFAMTKSGAAKVLADIILGIVSDPFSILVITVLFTGLITNVMSNTAATAMMVPLVIPLALDLGISPLPFAMGITAIASACFLTPIATPSNTMVLKPGGYSFGDYVKYGWPLQIVAFLLVIFLVPWIWPF